MLTPKAKRLVVLAGSSWSFDIASDRLHEFCGLRVSDQTIRRASDQVGRQARDWLEEDQKTTEAYRQASGQGEFYTDGTKINTTEGWREMRLNIFAKRPAGPAAKAEQWSSRELPKPTARVAFGGVDESEALGKRWAGWAGRLGVGRGQGLSVLGDGAGWIWNQANQHLPQAEQVVDIYHVSEHQHDCAKLLYGEGTEAQGWVEGQLLELMRQHPVHYLQKLDARRQGEQDVGKLEALEALYRYLSNHCERLDYRTRLAQGRTIGSGMIEGGCKTVVGRRLKAISARWRVERAEHMTSLCCLHYSDLWPTFWDARPARFTA